MLRRLIGWTGTAALAALLFAGTVSPPARADDDDRRDRGHHYGRYYNRGHHYGWYHNRGRHNGWYRNRRHRTSYRTRWLRDRDNDRVRIYAPQDRYHRDRDDWRR